MLVDSHCHLNYPEFADLPAVLARAEARGVRLCQTISTKRCDFACVTDLAERYDAIYASIGIHPHEVAEHTDLSVEELVEWAAHPKVIGLGETGLDYYYEHSPRAIQQQLFRIHIAAARETGLPLIVHTRDADDDTIAILQEEYANGPFKGLIHCFSSSKYLAEKAIEIGFMISISGIITFQKADALRAIVSELPLTSLLVETDAPYLAPAPHRGKPNEPAFTELTAQKLAEIKGVGASALAEATTDNFFRLFQKAARPQ